jgi:ferrochelatase
MGKTGVLLINLGTPDATDYWSMRRYLKQFLSDKRVVEAKGPLWWLIFNAIILTKRPHSSGHAYDLIWNRELNESPLRTITRAQSGKLAANFTDQSHIIIEWAMRYGTPSIAAGIKRLIKQSCDRILFFPLYPQYSSATTGTAMDAAFDMLKTLRSQPVIRSVPPYFNHPAYINALAESIRSHHSNLTWAPEVIIASLHGLPVEFINKGDPYQSQCETTANLLRKELGLKDWQLLLTYQSRSGRAEWIEPDTEETITGLARDGIKNLSIISPGFAGRLRRNARRAGHTRQAGVY